MAVVNDFLNSNTPLQDFIRFAAIVQDLRLSVGSEGCFWIERHLVDQVAKRVIAISQGVFEGTLFPDTAEVRFAGRQVVKWLGEAYREADEIMNRLPFAEYGCTTCQEKATSLGMTISPEEGLPQGFDICDGCKTFKENRQYSDRLGISHVLKNRANTLFLDYRRESFFKTFGREWECSGVRTVHPALDRVLDLSVDHLIAKESALQELAQQILAQQESRIRGVMADLQPD